MMQKRKGRLYARAGIAIAAVIAVAASVSAAAGSSNADLSCPAGTKVIVQHARYAQTDPIEGFDTPEEAVDYLVTKAYPGMPRGKFKKVSSDQSKAALESENAHSTAIEVDRLVPNAEQTELVLTENGTAWVVEEFKICESNARRWAAR